jgi:hypothetical protein
MIVKLNGEYTKEFLELADNKFHQPDFEVFKKFCKENYLTTEDVTDILEILNGPIVEDIYVDD